LAKGGNNVILAKNTDILDKYDFVDSIVTSIKWDVNMLDFLVTVDYYYGSQNEEKELTLRFKNCREAELHMPKAFDSIPKNELNSYVFSWYTITNCIIVSENGLLKAGIKTVDDSPKWLTAICDEIWLEIDNDSQIK
jgi:hypothetical protein